MTEINKRQQKIKLEVKYTADVKNPKFKKTNDDCCYVSGELNGHKYTINAVRNWSNASFDEIKTMFKTIDTYFKNIEKEM